MHSRGAVHTANTLANFGVAVLDNRRLHPLAAVPRRARAAPGARIRVLAGPFFIVGAALNSGALFLKRSLLVYCHSTHAAVHDFGFTHRTRSIALLFCSLRSQL